MPGSAAAVAAARSQTQSTRGRRQTAASLPLDVLVDIATRSDPATLVRCAATCVDMRCRIKDGTGLRLRHSDRFVPSLLRSHLIFKYVFLVDSTAQDATRLRRVTSDGIPLASRDGLVLVLTRVGRELRVCDPATGSSQTLPPRPAFPVGVDRMDPGRYISYVLIVGGGGYDSKGAAFGRHFQVVMAYLELSLNRRVLQLLTFSSEHGVWGRCTEARAHNLCGSYLQRGLGRALVIGGTVHWLAMSDTSAYLLKLHVKTAHLTVTMLPKSFGCTEWDSHLLATSSAGATLIVLVTDGLKIWAWSKQTSKWQQRPEAVTDKDAISRFLDKEGRGNNQVIMRGKGTLGLVCFAERSGIVLITSGCTFFWLDLRSMEIVRCFSDSRLKDMDKNIPYEVNLTEWVPTFRSTL
ncbi:hypothetical protein ZWY2020_011404 [Hordeum vulgare]|nr:hypothetical protein ZWY2020_011404 [Hordeum vulgare]